MKIRKKIIFVCFFYCLNLFSSPNDYSCKEKYNENQLLKDLVINKLDNSETEHNLCFCGNANLSFASVNQNISLGRNNEHCFFQGNANLRYIGSSNECFGYGFEINAKDSSGIIKRGAPIIDSSYLFIEFDKIGEFRVGYTNSSADKFSIKGDDILIWNTGFGSRNLCALYNASSGSIIETRTFVDDVKAAKISWSSPVFRGFSLGVSYAIDSRYANLFKKKRNRSDFLDNGRLYSLYSDENQDFVYSQNAITAGASYEYGSKEDFYAKAAVAGWFAEGKSVKSTLNVNNVRAFHLGGKIGYKNFKLSIGFTDNGKSLLAQPYNNGGLLISNGKNSGKIYSFGASCDINEKIEISAGYFSSTAKFSPNNEKSRAKIVSLAAEYKANDYVSMYVEYDNIKTNTGKMALKLASDSGLPCIGKNRANIFIIGTKFSF